MRQQESSFLTAEVVSSWEKVEIQDALCAGNAIQYIRTYYRGI